MNISEESILPFPEIIFGNSYFGNLYQVVPEKIKSDIVTEWFRHTNGIVMVDTAGKYGAGLALESLGRHLKNHGIDPEQIVISNKLGWKRIPLTTKEPAFEPGIWHGLENDARQAIGYDEILDCWEQGCSLLGSYRPQLISVHDPDEYLNSAISIQDRETKKSDIREAYRALHYLKDRGLVKGVGVGAKDWKIIHELHREVELDWVMFANSLTIMNHPPELLSFIRELAQANVSIVNSAVFHGGFLTGGNFYDYKPVDEKEKQDKPLFEYRERFVRLCKQFEISPALVCIQFGFRVPGVHSVALNTSRPERVKENVAMGTTRVPETFWNEMKKAGLL